MITRNRLIFLPFLALVYAQCDWTPTNLPAIVTDLRTATPFTYTNYIYGITGCTAAPSTDILWVTAEVSGNLYPAVNSQVEVHSIAPTINALFPFPGLIMTNLHQGDLITLSWSQTLIPQSLLQSGVFEIAVATNAFINGGTTTVTAPVNPTQPTQPTQITVTVTPNTKTSPIIQTQTITNNGVVQTLTTTPTGTVVPNGSSSTSTNAAATTTGSSSSAPIGAIVGGVIGGLALLAALGALAFIMMRRKRNDQAQWQQAGAGGGGGGGYPPPPPVQPEADKYAGAPYVSSNQYGGNQYGGGGGMEQSGMDAYHGAPSNQALRYPDQIPSGAVQGNY